MVTNELSPAQRAEAVKRLERVQNDLSNWIRHLKNPSKYPEPSLTVRSCETRLNNLSNTYFGDSN